MTREGWGLVGLVGLLHIVPICFCLSSFFIRNRRNKPTKPTKPTRGPLRWHEQHGRSTSTTVTI